MSPATKVAARGAIFSLPVGVLMMYWSWRIFPSITNRLAGFVLIVIALVPASSISAVAVWWGSLRWGRRPLLAMVIGMSVGVLAVSLEALLLHLGFPNTFGKPFSIADILPGLLVGAIIGFSSIGPDGSTRSN